MMMAKTLMEMMMMAKMSASTNRIGSRWGSHWGDDNDETKILYEDGDGDNNYSNNY